MVQISEFFLCDDLLSLLEDMYEECTCKKEDIIRQIALIHILTKTPNKDKRLLGDNIRINEKISNYYDKIQEFKEKWTLD